LKNAPHTLAVNCWYLDITLFKRSSLSFRYVCDNKFCEVFVALIKHTETEI
jgi:hypothetical protein